MRLDYTVDLSNKAKETEDENRRKAEDKKKSTKTRTSMQATVMSALAGRQPQDPGMPIQQMPGTQTGWGGTQGA